MSEASPRSRIWFGAMRARQWVLLARIVGGGAIAVFALSTPGFTSQLSINSLLNAISFIGCVAVGMTFITITGNIMSLALGATVSASALIFLASLSLGVFPAFLVAILFGIVITAVQGALVGYIRANPILVSIAALSLLIGGAALLTGGQRIYPGGEGPASLKGPRRRHSDRDAVFFCNRADRTVHPVLDAHRARNGRWSAAISVPRSLQALTQRRPLPSPMYLPARVPPYPAFCLLLGTVQATWSLVPDMTTRPSPPCW